MKCKICWTTLKAVTNTHLKKHNTTQEAYIKKYWRIRTDELQKVMYRKHSDIMSELRASWRVVPPPMSKENREKLSTMMKRNNPMKDRNTVKKVMQSKQWMQYDYSFNRDAIKRENCSKRMKVANPMFNKEIVQRNAISHNRKKSWIENKFIEHTNWMWIDYVWNNKLRIGHKNPDFVVNWYNTVIEVTSDAYKRLENNYEEERILHFTKHWYNCITVRITKVYKAFESNMWHTIRLVLNKIIHEKNSYQVYHDKEWRVYCLQFWDEKEPQLFC